MWQHNNNSHDGQRKEGKKILVPRAPDNVFPSLHDVATTTQPHSARAAPPPPPPLTERPSWVSSRRMRLLYSEDESRRANRLERARFYIRRPVSSSLAHQRNVVAADTHCGTFAKLALQYKQPVFPGLLHPLVPQQLGPVHTSTLPSPRPSRPQAVTPRTLAQDTPRPSEANRAPSIGDRTVADPLCSTLSCTSRTHLPTPRSRPSTRGNPHGGSACGTDAFLTTTQTSIHTNPSSLAYFRDQASQRRLASLLPHRIGEHRHCEDRDLAFDRDMLHPSKVAADIAAFEAALVMRVDKVPL